MERPSDGGGLGALVIMLLIIWGLFLAIVYTADKTPVVYWSVSKDECVEVFNCDCNCFDLPETYEKVWVE